MIAQWAVATGALVSLATGTYQMIRQKRENIALHEKGLKQVTRSLIQRPRPEAKVIFIQKGRQRSYEFSGKKNTFYFSSSYRKHGQ